MIVRLVSYCRSLALQFLSPLAVDLQATMDLIYFAVVLEYPAHVVQHPHDGFAYCGCTVI